MSNETVDKIRALNAEVQRLRSFQERHSCGFQGGGVSVQGNKQSITKVQEWLNAYENQELFRKEIRTLRQQIAEIEGALG